MLPVLDWGGPVTASQLSIDVDGCCAPSQRTWPLACCPVVGYTAVSEPIELSCMWLPFASSLRLSMMRFKHPVLHSSFACGLDILDYGYFMPLVFGECLTNQRIVSDQ